MSGVNQKLEEIVEDPGNEDGKTPYKGKAISKFKGEEASSIKKLRLKPTMIDTGKNVKVMEEENE